MEIIKKRIADMERAEYNPRVELMPGDDEYEKLKRNIDRFGVVVPVIWNKRTNRVVSGHQRLTVLMNEGVTETDVSVVDLDETAEKQLNIAMNKVTGEWDEVKLKELLDGLGDAAPETGFDLYEIEALENNVDALVDGDFLDSELKSIEETFNISLKFSAEDRDVLKEYIKDNGRDLMGCKCGSQIILCNLPVRFDTYRGCSHGCRYCFAQKKNDISHIERDESVDGLRSFIEGKRGNETEWCDWNIPIHWGGMSDPFQPVEKQIHASYECLKLLAETKYPFVVSTKGRLIADPEYLDLLAQCNCVLQISMVCSKYDRLERGTPSYEERLTILKTVSARVQRTIVRIQPYMPEVFHDVMKNIPRIAEAGAYGVIVEGMKFFKAKPGMTKIGGDFCYPLPRLRHDFEAIKAECHRYGLKFYSGENRLRAMGDSMTCCGIDGLPGFRPNEYNLCMLMNGKNPEPTEKMKEVGTGGPFKTLNQSAGSGRKIAKQSFYGLMQEELAKKTDYHRKVFGLDE